eukprot:366157-Chlamydomonas_euryale.AAC.5
MARRGSGSVCLGGKGNIPTYPPRTRALCRQVLAWRIWVGQGRPGARFENDAASARMVASQPRRSSLLPLPPTAYLCPSCAVSLLCSLLDDSKQRNGHGPEARAAGTAICSRLFQGPGP